MVSVGVPGILAGMASTVGMGLTRHVCIVDGYERCSGGRGYSTDDEGSVHVSGWDTSCVAACVIDGCVFVIVSIVSAVDCSGVESA